MKIYLKKFGTTLTSRQLGKESFFAIRPQLADLKKNEKIEIDFEGVNTFSPSWGDEFLTPLLEGYGKKITLVNAQQNPSVKETLKLLEEIIHIKFIILN
jgi:hypothetical protein